MESSFRIAAIGELLWDLLPSGPELGGAPANFAAMSAKMAATVPGGSADAVFLISRVGDDVLGRKALRQLAAHRLKLDFISTDPQHPTGTVTVTNAEKDPAYCIHEQAAWDYIPCTQELAALAPTLDAVCFGTLAQRSAVSRSTLREFVESTRGDCVRVFDVNLRAPYWSQEAVSWGCAHSTILKMNLEEVPQLARAIGSPVQEQSPVDLAQCLLRRFSIDLIAITRGAKGSLLVTHKGSHEHPGIPVELVDSIGAGDAFTAALTHSVLLRLPLPAAADTANRWGAWAAAQRGGMPAIGHHLAEPAFSLNNV